jgi:hypothetical protein
MQPSKFVQLICLSSLLVAAAIWHFYPPAAGWDATIFVLTGLALTAELMGFLLPRGAS